MMLLPGTAGYLWLAFGNGIPTPLPCDTSIATKNEFSMCESQAMCIK